MRHQWLIGAALAVGVPASLPRTLPAQEPEVIHDDPFEMRVDHGPDRLMTIVMNRRARLGIKVNLRARDTDSVGAYVDAVTPGGPADQAGIRSGDVITKLDGKSMLSGARPEPVHDRRSVPGLRLIELAARLAPRDTVPVEYRRGTELRTATLVTEDEPELQFAGREGGRRFAIPLGPRAMAEDLDFPPHLEFLSRSPLGDLELAPLNPDLGQYFGATDGVLVVSVPKDSELGLKGGDVVLAVDGRKPAGPAHLLRILRSYDREETFKLDVLRHRKRETVTARLGERPT